jgi:hypothetical protein
MTMILVGSRAVRYHLPEFRKPKDWDIICTRKDVKRFFDLNRNDIVHLWPKEGEGKFGCHINIGEGIEVIEFDTRESKSNQMLIRMSMAGTIRRWDMILHVPALTTLMKLKESHIILPRHWEKNIADYHYLKLACGDPTEEDEAFFRVRRKEHQDGAEWINLNVTNENFFGQSDWSAKRIICHDDIHEAIKYQKVPIYAMCKKDPTKAIMDKKMFFRLPRKFQIQAVREEAMAIAIERGLIPMSYRREICDEDVKAAYNYAIRRICTTLTKGWFRKFAYEHWPLSKDIDKDFWGEFKEKCPQAIGIPIIYDYPRDGDDDESWFEDSDMRDKEW